MGFVSLHNHSDHSLRDGFQSVENMLSYASALGQGAIALTDHGTMSGCGEGFRYAEKYGIKFIVGCEHYLVPDVTIKGKFNQHIILLAMNKTGYRNLNILTTMAHSENNFYFKPRIDLSLLEKYNEGLICTTACIAGCQSKIPELKEIFGDRLYVEIHTNSMQEQKNANMQWLQLAEKYDVLFYAATDSHYTIREQATFQEMWQVGDYQNPPDFYLHNEDEVRRALAYLGNDVVDLSIKNTQLVADRCDFKPDLGNNHYPKSPYSSPKDEIRKRVWEGMKKKGLQKDQTHIDQVKHELNILEKVGYFDYFCIVGDMLDYCKHNDIRTGVGRGSVVGCDVAYLMGITGIDPIKNGLIFERFAHTERVTPADIDTDVPRSKRQDVIQYLKDTYGYVYQVTTFNKMADKASIRRACEAFKIEPKKTNTICNLFSDLEEMDKCSHCDYFSLPREFDFFKKTVHQFHGKLQNYGTHASAVVVISQDPYDFCAVERFSSANGIQYNLNYDFHDLESMGLLKLDILGLETLDIIDNTLALAGLDKDCLDNLECCDLNVYNLLWHGHTAGVFQLEGSAVKGVCSKVRPIDLSELTAVVALGRPGSMKAGATAEYIGRKNKVIFPVNENSNFGRLCKETFGCMIYQEQVMSIVQDCFGLTLGEADMVRRAIGRKDKEVMNKVIEDLRKRKNTWNLNAIGVTDLLNHINVASGYLFNKSHSAAYAYTAYQTAWLKTYYPFEFYTSLLNSNIDQDKALEYIKEAQEFLGKDAKIIEPVSITESEPEWTTNKKHLRMGFSYIKGVGNAKFTKPSRDDEAGLEEFMTTNPSLNKQVCVNLVKAGAFAVDPQWGLDYIDWFKTAYKRKQECLEKMKQYGGQTKRYNEWHKKLYEIPDPPDVSSYNTDTDTARMMQMEVIGTSTIPFWTDYDKSLCNNRVKIVSIATVLNLTTKKGVKFWKVVAMGDDNRTRDYLFWNPSDNVKKILQSVDKGDVVLVQIGRRNTDGSCWCNDIVKAIKVNIA